MLRLWIGSSNTNICQGKSTWPCHTSSAISLRNFFQLFTTSTSTRISSCLICMDCTTLQLSLHTFKVIQSLQYYIVCTDRLQATKSAAPWWKPVVDFGLLSGEPSCTCKDWVKYHIPCKHLTLLWQKKCHSTEQLEQEVRITLKSFSSITYNCTDEQQGILMEINNKLHLLLTDFQSRLPHNKGLLLGPELRKTLCASQQL